MTEPFPRLARAFAKDDFGRSLAMLVLMTSLLALWVGWASLASISVQATGRVRIERTIHPVQAPVPGPLLTARPKLRQHVRKGEVLFELDAESQILALREAELRHEALAAERRALKDVIEAAESTLDATRKARARAVRQARAHGLEVEASARLAEAEAAQVEELVEHMAELQRIRSTSVAAQRQSAAEASRHAISRLKWDYLESERERRTLLATRRRDLVRLEGSLSTLQARIDQLRQEIEIRSIRAPATGVIAEIAGLEPGVMIAAHEKLAVIVSPTDLKAVGEFEPADAVGRIHPDQRADVRLDGFPWTQFGTVPARVERVASEVRDGTIRVELALQPTARDAIPLQHGLQGAVEVAVERVTPFALLLRAAGRMTGERRHGPRRAFGSG